MSYLSLRNLSKSYGTQKVLDNLDLDLERGRFLTLLGSSGCGKSTTLRLISGLLRPDSGTIELAGRDITDVPVHKRNTILVFQSYALFPHMTVFDNVAYGLKRRRVSKDEIERKVNKILSVTRLDGLGGRYPGELSGGQQQRVALARSLVIEPDLLLLDEPLSNLDAKLRNDMRIEIRMLHERLGLTTIFVTHDQQEAFSVSDDIVLLNHGRVEQRGTPETLFKHPRTTFAADFLGVKNIFEGSFAGGVFSDANGIELHGNADLNPTTSHVGLRPSSIVVDPHGGQVDNTVRATLKIETYQGEQVELRFDVNGKEIVAEIPSAQYDQSVLERGAETTIGWRGDQLIPLID